MDVPWEFWIDVGGTFTDCFARRGDGSLRRGKVLSSGVTKGTIGDGSRSVRIVDPLRQADPPSFWRGYRLQLFDAHGGLVEEITVADSEGDVLHLRSALKTPPQIGQGYELAGGEEAPILAIRQLLGLSLDQPLPPAAVRLGTTRGTNALITRGGARTALVITRGFGDVLKIGYQNRPRLFDLNIHKPQPLTDLVIEIDERTAPDGTVLVEPDPARIRSSLQRARDLGIESLAVCLLNAYSHPRHEQLVQRIAGEVGFEEISVSSRVAPLIKIVSRGDTTVVDAYLNPVLRWYVQRLRESLDSHGGAHDLRILTSAGGLVKADRFQGKDSILSGPAGGAVGFARVAQSCGFHRAIGFDMGGTSTDVSRFDGRHELQFETERAGVRIVAPMLAIETVAAGGGSICRFDGVKPAVGPDSAGADPGPACYGRGGPLTVTDMNFFLGKILPEHFPFPLDRDTVDCRLSALCDEIDRATGKRYDPVELADGFLRVANANMSKAIRSISIAKGYDPRDYVLVAFGGAAPQHACAIARELGIREVLNHADAGILSAYGIGMADVVRHRAEGVYQPYEDEAIEQLSPVIERLAGELRREVKEEGVASERIETACSLDLRYRGMDAYLTIPQPCQGTYAESFAVEHRRLYGYTHDDRPLEIVAVRVEAVGRSDQHWQPSHRVAANWPKPHAATRAYFDATPQQVRVFERQRLQRGDIIAGPAIVVERVSTTVIDPDWQAAVLSGGELLLTDCGAIPAGAVSTDADPIMLEVFNNQFAGIAEQMGVTLRNTASSVNVKERLDFSCALFTATGELVVNAPHIPVHLGAMSETVRCIIADNSTIQPGDVFVTNDPYCGGSHLPDITVVSPVHHADTDQLLFFTASRAHHAEIGGVAPGSMPPFSTNLAEEGVLIRNFKVVDAGRSRSAALRDVLLSARYPTRSVDDNLADVAAQIAANRQGVHDLLRLVEKYTLPVVEAYMVHIQRAAEQKMRAALARLPDGRREFVDHLDDGSAIAVAITIEGDSAKIDFTGSGGVLPGNLNANRAIVSAAVLYVLRCLIDEDIPLNQGVLAPVEVILPEGLLNPPRRETAAACAAVVGGNVETSQRIVDALLGALGIAAASQGTMNNLLFGDATFGYYETICGGAGATADRDGADAVHTHMTNTRLTDPEVIERRYPVRVREFSIRRNSGGAGRQRGGDGVVRRLEFLQPLELSILSQRRGPYPPYGMNGGMPGATGRQYLTRRDGRTEELPALAHVAVEAGDVLTIETPGGGGFGAP